LIQLEEVFTVNLFVVESFFGPIT